MKCSCCLHTLLLLVILQLGLVHNSVCQAIQYSDIIRNLNSGNNQAFSQQQPSLLLSPQSVQPASSAAYIDSNTVGSSAYDERISDYIAGNVLNFARYLGQYLGERNYMEKTEVFSPVSIMSALALLMLGAKGRSYEELKPLFGLDNDAELLRQPSKFHTEFALMLEDLQRHGGGEQRQNAYWRQTVVPNLFNPKLKKPKPIKEHITKIANGLFTQMGFSLNPDYKSVINTVYHSLLAPLDFAQQPNQARNTINQWVESSTYGKIRDMLTKNLPRDTNVVIASALYFKGYWELPFLQAGTMDDNFYPDGMDQEPITVKIMGTTGIFPFYKDVENDCRIIGLPYQDNVTTMYIIMPNESSRSKLRQLQLKLDANKIEQMISRMVRKTAVVALPKMHIKRSFNLVDTLNKFGVTEVFASGLGDLSLIGGRSQDRRASQAAAPPREIVQRTQAEKPIVFAGPMSVSRFSEGSQIVPAISTRWLPDDGQYRYSNSQTSRRRIAKRQVPQHYIDNAKHQHLNQLESDRLTPTTTKSEFYVGDIVHQVDIEINEEGTEAAAATLIYSRRAGTEVYFRADAPFMFLIRHDPTKLVTFYGIVNEPV